MQPEESQPLCRVAADTPKLQEITAVSIHCIIQEVQEDNEECRTWRNYLAAEGYRVDNGPIWKDSRHQEPRLYVPRNVCLEIIKHFYDDPEASRP